MSERRIDALIEWARNTATYVTDEQDAINLGAVAAALEALKPGPDDWEYGRAGRFVDDGTDAKDDYWYGPRGAAEANISLLNEKEGVEPFDTRIEYRLVRRRKAGPREEVSDGRA